MKMIVGLGNIGKEYENTRHNIGFMVLDSFSYSFLLEKKFQAFVSMQKIEGESCLFVKPTTFMNLSGQSVGKLQKYYDIDPKDILVIHDDLDLPFGQLKIKKQGSSGGHNGIKSIIQALNTEEFCHLKIGIGHDRDEDTIDYVLGKFSKSNLEFFQKNYPLYQQIIVSFIKDGIEKTMSKYNSKDGQQ